jgi:hypothetical protein
MFDVAEVMAVRPEDRYARQVQQAFADGATLAELEQHLALLRSLGAPDDAHPRVGVNEDYEVTMMICVVRRPTLQASSPSLSPPWPEVSQGQGPDRNLAAAQRAPALTPSISKANEIAHRQGDSQLCGMVVSMTRRPSKAPPCH